MLRRVRDSGAWAESSEPRGRGSARPATTRERCSTARRRSQPMTPLFGKATPTPCGDLTPIAARSQQAVRVRGNRTRTRWCHCVRRSRRRGERSRVRGNRTRCCAARRWSLGRDRGRSGSIEEAGSSGRGCRRRRRWRGHEGRRRSNATANPARGVPDYRAPVAAGGFDARASCTYVEMPSSVAVGSGSRVHAVGRWRSLAQRMTPVGRLRRESDFKSDSDRTDVSGIGHRRSTTSANTRCPLRATARSVGHPASSEARCRSIADAPRGLTTKPAAIAAWNLDRRSDPRFAPRGHECRRPGEARQASSRCSRANRAADDRTDRKTGARSRGP